LARQADAEVARDDRRGCGHTTIYPPPSLSRFLNGVNTPVPTSNSPSEGFGFLGGGAGGFFLAASAASRSAIFSGE
jgi:hypothetical protein